MIRADEFKRSGLSVSEVDALHSEISRLRSDLERAREALSALLKRGDDFRQLFRDDSGDQPALTLDVDANDLADLYDGLFLASMDARSALSSPEKGATGDAKIQD